MGGESRTKNLRAGCGSRDEGQCLDAQARAAASGMPSAALETLMLTTRRQQNRIDLAPSGAWKGTPMARKLSIVLAVVLAIFVASPNLGHAQGRGGGWHGGGWHGGGWRGGGWRAGGWRGGGWGWRGGGWGWGPRWGWGRPVGWWGPGWGPGWGWGGPWGPRWVWVPGWGWTWR